MLKQKRLPTPLVLPENRAPVEILEKQLDARLRSLQVISKLSRHIARLILSRFFGRRTKQDLAVGLRQMFESLGGLWIKVGQLLSLRSDYFSPEVCEELSRLQYRASGFPGRLARETIERELGFPLEHVFAEFEDVPIAAASICQVHRAVLREGRRDVVVKVQRPRVHEVFEKDFALVRILIRFLERLVPQIRMGEALWELEQIIHEELDYRYEAANIRRLRKTLRKHKIYVPKAYEDRSTSRVLVLEYVGGVLMSDYIAVRESDPDRLATWREENDIDPEKVGERLFLSALRQLQEDSLFHADLHPGNIMLLRKSRIALIDLGTIGSPDVEFIELYKACLQSMSTRDFARAADLVLRMCPELPSVNLPALREDLVRCYRSWEARSHLRNLSYHEKSLASVGTESGRVMFDYGVQLSWAFMRVSRTWATLDASLNYLVPNVDYMELFGKYFRKHRKRIIETGLLERAQRSMTSVAETVREVRLLTAPIMRRQALMFQGTAGKLASAFALFFSLNRLLTLVGLVVLVTAFIHQHHGELAYHGNHALVIEVLEDIPRADYLWWVIGLFGMLTYLIFCHRMVRALRRREYLYREKR